MRKDLPQHLLKNDQYVVNYLVYLDENKDKHFVYLAVKGDNMKSFLDVVRQGSYQPEDHGIVLEYGSGEADDMLKAKMEFQYKCNHSNMITMI